MGFDSPLLHQLPVRTSPVRFAIGAPHGLSSNSWRVWATPNGNAYISCRDNFKEAKVSLHTSGRWRTAFREEAVADQPSLVPAGQDRAWEVWDRPPPVLPDTTVAVHLLFPTSELAVTPEQRATKVWRDNTIYIEAAPAGSGKLIAVTVFVTEGDPALQHAREPSIRLASLVLPHGRRLQLVAYAEPEGDVHKAITEARAEVFARAEREGADVPASGHLYFFGNRGGARFIVSARAHPAT